MRRDIYEAVAKRDDYRCKECGSTDLLEQHHLLANTKPNREAFPEFVESPYNRATLCKRCHERKAWKWRLYPAQISGILAGLVELPSWEAEDNWQFLVMANGLNGDEPQRQRFGEDLLSNLARVERRMYELVEAARRENLEHRREVTGQRRSE